MAKEILIAQAIDSDLLSEINFWAANKDFFMGGDSDLILKFHSKGGSVSDGIAIINTLNSMGLNIEGRIVGDCQSMAVSVALGACKVVKMYDNATLMIHEGSLKGTIDGTISEINDFVIQQNAQQDKIISIIAKKTGKPDVSIKTLYFDGKDHYFSANEALGARLIDEILLSGVQEMGAMTTMSGFDLLQTDRTFDVGNAVSFAMANEKIKTKMEMATKKTSVNQAVLIATPAEDTTNKVTVESANVLELKQQRVGLLNEIERLKVLVSEKETSLLSYSKDNNELKNSFEKRISELALENQSLKTQNTELSVKLTAQEEKFKTDLENLAIDAGLSQLLNEGKNYLSVEEKTRICSSMRMLAGIELLQNNTYKVTSLSNPNVVYGSNGTLQSAAIHFAIANNFVKSAPVGVAFSQVANNVVLANESEKLMEYNKLCKGLNIAEGSERYVKGLISRSLPIDPIYQKMHSNLFTDKTK